MTLFSDRLWPSQVRLCVNLPHRASGARLYYSSSLTRCHFPAQVLTGGKNRAFLWAPLFNLCEFQEGFGSYLANHNATLCITNDLFIPFLSLQSLIAVFSQITSTNITCLLLGLACVVFLYGVKVLNERFKKRLPVPIPGEIIVVIVSTGVSFGLSLKENYNVDIVGSIPTG